MSTVIPMGHDTRFRDARARHPAGRRPPPGRTAPRRSVPRPPRRPVAARRTGAPDPMRLIVLAARAYLEIEAGRRPLSHLEPLLAPGLAVRLAASLPRKRCPGPAVDAVRTVRCSQSSEEAVDGVAVVRRGQRVGALSIRVERHRGSWRVVELALPEEDAAAPDPRQVS